MEKKIFLMKLFAFFVIVILPLSYLLNHTLWHIVSSIYIFVSLSFIWFLTIILFIAMLKDEEKLSFTDEYFSVLVPVFNEDKEKLITTIKSIIQTTGNKKILIVDDGSTNGIWTTIESLWKMYPNDIVHIHRFEKNKGKREAQSYMVDKSTTELIVSVDSNSTFDKDVFMYLIHHLKDASIGLVTGQVLIKDEFKTLKNRIQGALWWCASNKGRLSLSNFGVMGSACGKIMAFRRKEFLNNVEEFKNQTFLGNKVISGDDGFLTSLYIRDGFKIRYEPRALCYGYAKGTYRLYLKQQLRWKKNIIRRSVWALKNIDLKRSYIYRIYIIGNLFLPFILISLMTAYIISIILSSNYYSLIHVGVAILLVMLIQNFVMLADNRRRVVSFLPYTIFNILFLMPLWFIALFNIDDMKWGTR